MPAGARLGLRYPPKPRHSPLMAAMTGLWHFSIEVMASWKSYQMSERKLGSVSDDQPIWEYWQSGGLALIC